MVDHHFWLLAVGTQYKPQRLQFRLQRLRSAESDLKNSCDFAKGWLKVICRPTGLNISEIHGDLCDDKDSCVFGPHIARPLQRKHHRFDAAKAAFNSMSNTFHVKFCAIVERVIIILFIYTFSAVWNLHFWPAVAAILARRFKSKNPAMSFAPPERKDDMEHVYSHTRKLPFAGPAVQKEQSEMRQ